MTITGDHPNEPTVVREPDAPILARSVVAPEAGARDGPSGLGGWLILPAIGLILSPFRLLMYLNTEFLPIFQDGSWEAVTTPGSQAYHPTWGPLIIFEIVGNLFFVIFAIVLFVLFLMKSHRFSRLMIAFLLLNPLFLIFDNFLGNFIPYLAELDDPEIYKEIARSIVGAMIWVPYFLVSKRVKNTFVKPGVDRDTLEVFD